MLRRRKKIPNRLRAVRDAYRRTTVHCTLNNVYMPKDIMCEWVSEWEIQKEVGYRWASTGFRFLMLSKANGAVFVAKSSKCAVAVIMVSMCIQLFLFVWFIFPYSVNRFDVWRCELLDAPYSFYLKFRAPTDGHFKQRHHLLYSCIQKRSFRLEIWPVTLTLQLTCSWYYFLFHLLFNRVRRNASWIWNIWE